MNYQKRESPELRQTVGAFLILRGRKCEVFTEQKT